jgi:hypothetical protein
LRISDETEKSYCVRRLAHAWMKRVQIIHMERMTEARLNRREAYS